MAEFIASDLVGRVLAYMGQSAVAEIKSYFGGRSKMNKLKRTMEMIQARLFDAERQQEGKKSALVKLWLARLKSVLYELEDLFEDLSAANSMEEHMHINDGGKLIKPVRVLSLLPDRLKMNKTESRDVKAIIRELEAIASDMSSLNFRDQYPTDQQQGAFCLTKICRETHSFVMEEDVVGREKDKSAIVEMLLNTNLGVGSVSIIPIIGIGGIGKTALAQLCFNDRKVQQHFQLKTWACISETSNLQAAAWKILKSLTHGDDHG